MLNRCRSPCANFLQGLRHRIFTQLQCFQKPGKFSQLTKPTRVARAAIHIRGKKHIKNRCASAERSMYADCAFVNHVPPFLHWIFYSAATCHFILLTSTPSFAISYKGESSRKRETVSTTRFAT